MKKNETIISNNIFDTFQLPKDVLEGAFLITMTGTNELLIENFKHIVKFQTDNLILQCRKNQIHILGKNLNIELYSEEELKIKGVITDIKFV